MNYLEGFLDFCKFQRSLSENSLRGYQFDITHYLNWLTNRELDPLTVKVRDIDAYLISIRKENKASVQTVNRRVYALKGFYKWLLRNEYIEKNPLEFVKNIKEAKRLPRFLSPEQQEALIEVSQNGEHLSPKRDWLQARDHLMVSLLLDTGMRVSELCHIEVERIDLTNGTLRIVGKGNKERLIILSDRCIKAIKKYLNMVEQTNLNHGVGPGLAARGLHMRVVAEKVGMPYGTALNAIFCNSKKSGSLKQLNQFIKREIAPLPMKYLLFNQQGQCLNSRHVFRMIRSLGERAGIPHMHPHLLRHVHASNLRARGCDLALIAEHLGHSNISTTMIYAHISGEDFKTKLKEYIN